MTYDDFDITFCEGKTGESICSIKDRCVRYWSDEYKKEAERLNLKYFSFMLPDGESLGEKNCNMFWEKVN